MTAQEHFNQGVSEALKEAQKRANRECRPIRVEGGWVNPSIAALSRRNVEFQVPPQFEQAPSPPQPRQD